LRSICSLVVARKRSRFTLLAIAAAAVAVAGIVAVFALNNEGDRHVSTASGPRPATPASYTRFIDARFRERGSWPPTPTAATPGVDVHQHRFGRPSGGSRPMGKQVVFYRDHGTATIHLVGSDGQDEHQVVSAASILV
jgi:hypothetical protein